MEEFILLDASISILYNNLTVMGKKIENYVLDVIIGEGEFGKVYKAVNEKSGQVVAIKIIKVEKFKLSPKLEEFTINQIQTLSKIEDTTHVVRFIEILKTANNYYFVYEYCNGGTLEQQIKAEGRFSEEKALAYLADLFRAFQILIRFNIMHRDIKPSNILLNNGVLKLADFGFCKPLKDARDLSQTMLGSPIYMAPEILKGEAYTMKADIWSLGVVLYEMLYGFCPFEEKTIARLISLIDQTAVVFPSNVRITRKTEELLRRMLVKDHFKRIGWEELLATDLTIQTQQEKSKPTNANPFSKKTTFTSIITEEVRNRYLTPTDSYKPTSTQPFKPASSQPYKHPSPAPLTSLNSNGSMHSLEMRKKEQKSSLTAADRKLLQGCLDNRSRMQQGLRLLKGIIHESSSKLAIAVCAFLARKVQSLNRENTQALKKMPVGQQNREKAGQLKKMLGLLAEERIRVQQKLLPFEGQFQQVKQPLDILFLKFAEEEGLTQEKEGLLQLIEIYDYINDNRAGELSRLSKKQLLEEYEQRIFKKS